MLHFFRQHGYTLFVSSLVLALGAGSLYFRQMRTQPQPVSAAPLHTAAPVVPSAAPTAAPQRTWLRPVSGGMLTAYSEGLQHSADMDCWQVHAAVDLSAQPDEPVRAAAAGQVLSVAQDALLGLTVIVGHDDSFETCYSSLRSAACRPGDRLNAGDVLGTAGDSADSEALMGCHLHFEITQNGLPVKPVFE